MNTEPVIMVQIAEHKWTMDALYEACQMAHHMNARIALISLIPTLHASWLGTDLPYAHFDALDDELEIYEAMLDDFDVPYTSLLFQYMSLSEALAQAAEHVQADVVFARIPASGIPFWQHFQEWSLHRRFAQENRQWIQDAGDDSIPAVTERVLSEVAHHASV